jgi:hypothetical protein
MNWQIVHLADSLPRPWRNGGGVTRELACWPNSDDWIWRMSVAEVAHSGPFSRFDGVQRWFAVLAGAGVRLSMGEHSHELTGSSAPLCFDGAVPVDCQLLDGATQDFNLMVRSDQAAQMRRVSGDISCTLDAPKTIAIYAINTGAAVQFEHESVTIPAHSLAWRSLDAGATVQVSAADALWMEIDA